MSRLSRREVLQALAVQALAALPATAIAKRHHEKVVSGCVKGEMTGAEALVETLQLEGVEWVFGIPGAQNNELWDTMKSKKLGYLLATHEFSAAAMADGYARSTGKPGVLCTVPGPGLTNSLTGIGEALLDSIPMVCIVCDVARGEKYRPFQVHELPHVALLQSMTKALYTPQHAAEIPDMVRQAMNQAKSSEPGPVAILIPYPLFISSYRYNSPPQEPPGVPFDADAFQTALGMVKNPSQRIGIYAGLGCMDYSGELITLAEMLQAPVATSVSGKGVIPENHPLAVGWGYGPQGTRTAEAVFKERDLVLALGVRYSEVSTAFYSIPEQHTVIQVDANEKNLGAVVKKCIGVHADCGVFIESLLAHGDAIRRCPDTKLVERIRCCKQDECKLNQKVHSKCGTDPMAFVLALRRCCSHDALVFVDVTTTEHWAAEAYTVYQPRTYFNPIDNQEMGWSIPASIGAQRAFPGRQTVTITGDGCFLMSAMEISTAGREQLPVKFFVLDDHTYHIMQTLQKKAYKRTTATVLAGLDYEALAKGFGVGYQEIQTTGQVEDGIQAALAQPGPVLVRVVTDYGDRPIRWVDATRHRYTTELTTEQKIRFMARLGARSVQIQKDND
jgi:acetolactate synthase-1/2/3 large subunit